MNSRLQRIFTEPLAHFLVLGAVIFVVYGMVSHGYGDPGKIVVSKAQVESMVVGFTKAYQRAPTAKELEGLIQDRIREEVYVREAMAIGLDKDDSVIRRRLRQKLEFISDDVASQTEPTDADLATYLGDHQNLFRVERRYTFTQVYLDSEKHGENTERDAAQLLEQLKQKGDSSDPEAMGDAFLLGHTFENEPFSDLAKQFGDKFATTLGELSPGQWQGPVQSGYGLHLVLVIARTQGRVPALPEVRDAVRREWENARRQESNEKFYQDMLKRYTVTIERPQTTENGQ